MSRQLSSSRKHSIELPNKQLKQQNGVFSKRRFTYGLKTWGLGCGIFTKGHRRRETFASMFLFSSGQPLSKPMVQALNLIMKLKNISSGQKKQKGITKASWCLKYPLRGKRTQSKYNCI